MYHLLLLPQRHRHRHLLHQYPTHQYQFRLNFLDLVKLKVCYRPQPRLYQYCLHLHHHLTRHCFQKLELVRRRRHHLRLLKLMKNLSCFQSYQTPTMTQQRRLLQL